MVLNNHMIALTSRVLLLWLAVTHLAIQPSAAEIQPNYRVTRWTSENGLPQNTVRSLLQSRDGYLWIGTSYGVARYDGFKFTVYTSELQIDEPPELLIWDILEDSEGAIWIRTNHGLIENRQGSFKKHSFPDKGVIHSSHARSGGGLWLAMEDGLHHFDKGNFVRTYTMKDGLLSNHVVAVAEQGNGKLWLLFRLPNKFPHEWPWMRYNPDTGEYSFRCLLYPG